MSLGISKTPFPLNEPIYSYAPNSPEKKALKEALTFLKNNPVEIPLIIGGREVKSGQTEEISSPHDHSIKLAKYHKASREHIQMAIKASQDAYQQWSEISWEQRVAVFLKAAELISTKYRYILNATTMLGQGKNPFQAEIDSACELIDFLRFNAHYVTTIYRDQPEANAKGIWNRLEYRPLEGFIVAITPFNFTAIGGNLPTSPALMGNVVLWKPASSAVLSAYYIMKILHEAGLPAGVINMVPGKGSEIGPVMMDHPLFAGVHFTGSTSVFQSMWKDIGLNVAQGKYKSYPRIVGETGGKDFVIAHSDCDVDSLVISLIRGAYEYQGQKCSAASRAYIPKSIWPKVKDKMVSMINEIKMGDVEDFRNFMGAVIDRGAFRSITSYIDYAKKSNEATILAGGTYDDSKGFFIRPTLVETTNPRFKLMEEEIFGPVLTVYPYDDEKLDETMEILNSTSLYALTGAIFARDRIIIEKMAKALRHSAGNFYINDKPTGAVVGQQPFGGGRGSGTNDKAGSALNLMRWMSVRTIKETFTPFDDYSYPHMKEQ